MRGDFVTRRELRRINDLIERSYGARLDEDNWFYFMKKRDLYRVSRALERVDHEKIDEVFAGLYVCEVLDETVRFSVEGSQIIGPEATQRVVELSQGEWLAWLERTNVSDERFASMDAGFWIVKGPEGDFFGTGLLKDDVLKSWIPKGRAVGEAH